MSAKTPMPILPRGTIVLCQMKKIDEEPITLKTLLDKPTDIAEFNEYLKVVMRYKAYRQLLDVKYVLPPNS